MPLTMERLDKIISHAFALSRSDARRAIKGGEVCVAGKVCTSCDEKAAPEQVSYGGKSAQYQEHIYLMLNKPPGVVSASVSEKESTVVDLVPPSLQRRGLFPAGRLDKDTVGFVLITDDGAFAHEILSPKKHIQKTYLVRTDKPIPADLPAKFYAGVVLYDGTQCLSAQLKVCAANEAIVKIKEGKYHQIKRMFRANGLVVEYLKRTAIGNLALDEGLAEGECRELTQEELSRIRQKESE